MPTYQYACTKCGNELEAAQKFTDEPLKECPSCSGDLRKVFSAVGVVFKGSGFYRTDNRTGSSKESSKSTSATETKSSSDAGSATGSSPKSESKPAESKPKAKADSKA
ncbi:FmdB family zinc ribbon protein [Phytomonospora endophytica]|uniref:Putative FmdB family regulatory protein n=1 Tax=Phytomonospora endophytica TaxID=714109 RepID=A0A841G274_9ACTN|nr:FmdB family zinc ribbon protein [Phytomonospora endophytica]MBB6039747.1 putative FmdB family regulatory protein [Phytomonospora endophytica]GIG70917.1 FmdB family transcriptional regulator [Phytomonospora endophytica]